MPIANKIALVNQSKYCGVLALHNYFRIKENRPARIGTTLASMRRIAAEKPSRIQLTYQIVAACTMPSSRPTRATSQAAVAPEKYSPKIQGSNGHVICDEAD